MRKITLLCLCLFCSIAMLAGEITEEQALQKAREVLKGKQLERQQVARTRGESKAAPSYYVFNAEANGGFAVIAANDQMPEVLGYAEQGHLDPATAPDNVKWLLDYYASIAQSLKNAPVRSERAARTRNINTDARPELTPLMSTQWNQNGIYQDQCPVINGNKTYTGCVATAMAQVVNYFQWPLNSVREVVGYTSNKDEESKPKIDLPTLSARKFNWFNMTNDDIAWLMRYCGQSVLMNYNYYPDESLASSANIPGALISIFNFSKGIDRVSREEFTEDEWEEILYKEIELGRPVIYSGFQGETGHTFVLHGYKDGQFYINWGWGGDCDGLFTLTALTPKSTLNYSQKQEAVIGIQPASNNDISYEEKPEIGYREVVVKTPGDLDKELPKENNYRYHVSRLKVIGDINGTDIDVLRDMSLYKGSSETEGRLSKLDLSDAHILGGSTYSTNYTTKENVIGDWMFNNCDKIKELTLPKTTVGIGSQAFAMTGLTSMVIPKNVSTIEGNAFQSTEISSLVVDEQNEKFYSKDNAIYEKGTDILIRGCKESGVPEDVVEIGISAFNGAKLESIVLPKSLKKVGYHAFYDNNVKDIYIPEGLDQIGEGAFARCRPKTITVDKNNEKYDSRGNCNAIIEKETNTLLVGSDATVIPTNVTKLGDLCFAYSEERTFLDIPANVTSISYSFMDYSRIKTVRLHSNVPPYVDGSFSSSGIGNGVRLIVPHGTVNTYKASETWKIFDSESNKRYIVDENDYNQDYQTIDVGDNYNKLANLIYEAGITSSAEKLKVTGKINANDISCLKSLSSQYGILTSIDLSDATIVDNNGNATHVLPASAFQSASVLEHIILPNNLKEIGSSAFQDCGIKELVLPKTVTKLGRGIFYYTRNLESLSVKEGNTVYKSEGNAIIEKSTNKLVYGCKNTVIPSSVTSIGYMAFSAIPGLTEITIPNSVESMEGAVFWADESLSKVTLSANITNLGEAPFGACDRITTFTIDKGNNTYNSGNNSNAIIKTDTKTLIQGFSTTTIPDDVKIIAAAAFKSLSTLTEIEIPASVERIDPQAFQYCNHLTKVVSHIRKPFALSSMVFDGGNMKTAVLYVPYGTREAYANTPGWDGFRTIVEMQPVEGEYTKNGASVVTTDFGKGYAALNGKVSVPITLTGEGMDPVTSIGYTINNSTTEYQLELSEPITFMMQREVLVPINADATVGEREKVFRLTKVNGVANECTTGNLKATGMLVTVEKKPKVVPVVEEATGTWCGWCARGIPGLALLNKVYGGDVITLAVHGGGNDDPMILDGYQLKMSNYPSCTVNRGDVVDPYYGSGSEAFGISREVEAVQRSYVPAGVEVTAEWADANQTRINVKTTTTFVETISNGNYRIGYVLAEDGLKGNGPEWYQTNYYAGSSLKDDNLYNLTSGASKLTNVVYNYIPVAAYEPFDGIQNSVPTSITKDVANVHNYEININGNTRIQNKKNLSVVALLIDKTTGKIVNAAKFKFNKDSDAQTGGFQFLSLTPPVGKTGLIYNGAAMDLITAGSSTTGTVQYSLDGTNYSTTIPKGTNAKEYTVYYKVVGKDGFKGTDPESLKVTIAPKSVTSPKITLSQASYNYDGTAKQPTVTVKDGTTEIPASEYTVSYQNNIAIGTATVTITDKTGGNYTVSGSATFTIVLKGDTNGDGKVNVADIVKAIKDGKPQSEIDEIRKIIMGQ